MSGLLPSAFAWGCHGVNSGKPGKSGDRPAHRNLPVPAAPQQSPRSPSQSGNSSRSRSAGSPSRATPVRQHKQGLKRKLSAEHSHSLAASCCATGTEDDYPLSADLRPHSITKKQIKSTRRRHGAVSVANSAYNSSRVSGCALPLSRVLESHDAKELRAIIESIVAQHPEIQQEIVAQSPKPTVPAALNILNKYLCDVFESFPYRVDKDSDYAYLRVKPTLDEFFRALSDYTLNFLPPQEPIFATSMEFLDGATDLLHKLPKWNNDLIKNYTKNLAYEELSDVWSALLTEAYEQRKLTLLAVIAGDWESKIHKHNELSDGKMGSVVETLHAILCQLHADGSNGVSAGLGGVGAELPGHRDDSEDRHVPFGASADASNFAFMNSPLRSGYHSHNGMISEGI